MAQEHTKQRLPLRARPLHKRTGKSAQLARRRGEVRHTLPLIIKRPAKQNPLTSRTHKSNGDTKKTKDEHLP